MKFRYDYNLKAKFNDDNTFRFPCEIALRWMSRGFTDDKSKRIKKMASHYQGLIYPIAEQPRASKTTSQASGFGQSFLVYSIKGKQKYASV